MDLSLEEYIRRKKAENGLVNGGNKISKEKEEIDQDELDAELEEIMTGTATQVNYEEKNDRSSLSKFDRIRASNDSEDEEEDVPMNTQSQINTQNSSIVFAKKVQAMDHPHCCKFKPFTTIEDRTKVKIKSQQWRLGNGQNRENRDFDNNSGIRYGRVGKNYRNNGSNPSSNVVRGNFTYKLQNGNNEIKGIVRNNRQPITYESSSSNGETSLILRKTIRPPGLNRDIQVNVDLTSLLPITNQLQGLTAPRTESSSSSSSPVPSGMVDLRMSLETADLVSFLQARKKREEQKAHDAISQYERDALGGVDKMDTTETF